MKTLLCIANFPTNTGYAWDFIERLYAGIADRLTRHNVRTLVAYPSRLGWTHRCPRWPRCAR